MGARPKATGACRSLSGGAGGTAALQVVTALSSACYPNYLKPLRLERSFPSFEPLAKARGGLPYCIFVPKMLRDWKYSNGWLISAIRSEYF
jgi:hypothetical protein